jgi:hypothetical protein
LRAGCEALKPLALLMIAGFEWQTAAGLRGEAFQR